MLKIKTYLAPSQIHGIGLFAAETIKKETIVWQFTPHVDYIFSPRKFRAICQSLDSAGLQYFCSVTYKRKNRYYYLTDNTRFINHSETAYNIHLIDDFTEIALKDIEQDEEILENYQLSYDEDDPFWLEMKQINLAEYIRLPSR